MLKNFLATILVLILLSLHSQAFAFTNISADKPFNQETITNELLFLSSTNSTSNLTTKDIDGTQQESNSEQQPIDVKHPKLDITLSNAVHITIFISIFVIIAASTVIYLVRNGR